MQPVTSAVFSLACALALPRLASAYSIYTWYKFQTTEDCTDDESKWTWVKGEDHGCVNWSGAKGLLLQSGSHVIEGALIMTSGQGCNCQSKCVDLTIAEFSSAYYGSNPNKYCLNLTRAYEGMHEKPGSFRFQVAPACYETTTNCDSESGK